MTMDVTPLQVFLTVVEEGSFTRAAEKLQRTQPAVSVAVQRLEADLGEKLIDRSGRELSLTDAGAIVLEAARRQQNLQRELFNRLAELRHKAVGRLALGANESMILYLLPHLVRYRERYPQVQVVVQRTRSGQIPDHLLAGDVDFGVTSFRPMDDRFADRVFYKDHLAFVVAPGHRLAKKASVGIQELGRETFVAHNVASPYREVVLREFRRHKVALDMAIEMPTVESIRRMVAAGMGVAFLPRMTVEQDLAMGLLQELQVPEVQAERPIHLLWVEKRPLSHAARAFLELVGEG